MKHFKLNRLIGLSVTLSMVAALSACGPQAFVPGTVSSNAEGAGSMNIPPKVDIVLGVSQDGTMANIYSGSTGIQAGIQNLANKLAATGWDYRFVSISMSEHQPAESVSINNKVAASYYDGNWAPLGLWQSPYPNAISTAVAMASSLFTQYLTFPGLDTDPTHNDGREGGLRNQDIFINRADVQSGFIRPDALLAMITISTGDDKSRINLGSVQNCTNGGTMGYTYSAAPAEASEPYGYWKRRNNGSACVTAPGAEDYISQPNKLNYFRNRLAAAKSGSLDLVRYYSIVAQSTNCRGGVTRVGTTYNALSNTVGGSVIDLCTVDPSVALTQVANNLVQQSIIFKKSWLKLNSQPDPNTITVKKLTGTGEQVINQDPTNGWSLVTYSTPTSVYTIDGFKFANDPSSIWHPYQGGLLSGLYFIKLNGAAALIGGESARIEYMNNGAVISQ